MRRIVLQRIGLFQKLLAAADQVAQHAIDQVGERRALGIEPRGADREIDRGVVGRVEEEDLRACRDQNPFERPAISRQSFFDQLAQGEPDRAQPPQARRWRWIAPSPRSRSSRPVTREGVASARKALVKIVAALDDVADDGGGGDPRGKAGMGHGFAGRMLMLMGPSLVLSGAAFAGAAEGPAEIMIYSPRDLVGVARRRVSIMNLPGIFYHTVANIAMRVQVAGFPRTPSERIAARRPER